MTGPFGFSDAAKRCSDAVNTHLAALGPFGVSNKWVAIRLSDGGSDGVIYDTRRDAVNHQLHEQQCAYVCMAPDGMSAKEAESFLRYNRTIYDAGYRMPDPDREPIMPLISGHNPF